ncbi:MAG: phenylalanine--tRNA ligase subunit alpha [Pseudomonadota bacterium]
MEQQLLALLDEARLAFGGADGVDAVEALRVAYLGKKGKVSVILRQMGQLSETERPVVGKVANEVRDAIRVLVDEGLVRAGERQRARDLSERVDISQPGRRAARGREHPIMRTQREIVAVLRGLGFAVASGPEIEHDYYNFEALNFPHDHPARDMQDTFFVEDGVVLRTHTSPIQIRAMLAAGEPPLRVVAPGAVYRCDQDATHAPMFFQVEGFFVDEGVTFGDLKGTLHHFLQSLFGADVQMRLRPSFFPFTEPSCEVDMSCGVCAGLGPEGRAACRVCKGSGWVEILGAGMIDPNVLKAVGWDAEKYSGFAFGVGVDRVAMLRHGIDDIRLLTENDVRFLSQF